MKVVKGGCAGFVVGALAGGLLLAGPTIGNREFAHETTQSSLSMFILGAIPGAVLGLLVGLVVGVIRRPPGG